MFFSFLGMFIVILIWQLINTQKKKILHIKHCKFTKPKLVMFCCCDY